MRTFYCLLQILENNRSNLIIGISLILFLNMLAETKFGIFSAVA